MDEIDKELDQIKHTVVGPTSWIGDQGMSKASSWNYHGLGALGKLMLQKVSNLRESANNFPFGDQNERY